MKRLGPFRPFEITWEDCLLGGGVAAQFEDPSLPLHVEIGPGDDSFLMDSAGADPDANWLGLEYSRKRVRRYARRVERELGRPGNLRLLWRPAIDVVGPFLSPGKVAVYHIYFPDPWPKAHHARYRLMEPAFAAALRDSLVPGGQIQMATDSAEYAEEIVAVMAEVPGLVNDLDAPGYELRDEGTHVTAFEQRWREAGRQILALQFHKPAPEATGG
ncbi:MAG: hypothetical protein QNJ98_03005 [Planctomycetota bacterium]|nr:hypothetical protein [Planctomycetota bacterium]